jgi:hypothetical protein
VGCCEFSDRIPLKVYSSEFLLKVLLSELDSVLNIQTVLELSEYSDNDIFYS